jgi:hypothetical protein
MLCAHQTSSSPDQSATTRPSSTWIRTGSEQAPAQLGSTEKLLSEAAGCAAAVAAIAVLKIKHARDAAQKAALAVRDNGSNDTVLLILKAL